MWAVSGLWDVCVASCICFADGGGFLLFVHPPLSFMGVRDVVEVVAPITLASPVTDRLTPFSCLLMPCCRLVTVVLLLFGSLLFPGRFVLIPRVTPALVLITLFIEGGGGRLSIWPPLLLVSLRYALRVISFTLPSRWCVLLSARFCRCGILISGGFIGLALLLELALLRALTLWRCRIVISVGVSVSGFRTITVVVARVTYLLIGRLFLSATQLVNRGPQPVTVVFYPPLKILVVQSSVLTVTRPPAPLSSLFEAVLGLVVAVLLLVRLGLIRRISGVMVLNPELGGVTSGTSVESARAAPRLDCSPLIRSWAMALNCRRSVVVVCTCLLSAPTLAVPVRTLRWICVSEVVSRVRAMGFVSGLWLWNVPVFPVAGMGCRGPLCWWWVVL